MACKISGYILSCMLIFCLFKTGYSRSVLDLGEEGFTLSTLFHLGNSHPSVHRFARDSICQTIEKQIKFFEVLTIYLDKFSPDTIGEVVLDLCDRKDHMLDKWVSEIYDMDRDGYINHIERSRLNHILDD